MGKEQKNAAAAMREVCPVTHLSASILIRLYIGGELGKMYIRFWQHLYLAEHPPGSHTRRSEDAANTVVCRILISLIEMGK